MAALARLVEQGVITPRVDRVLDWPDVDPRFQGL